VEDEKQLKKKIQACDVNFIQVTVYFHLIRLRVTSSDGEMAEININCADEFKKLL